MHYDRVRLFINLGRLYARRFRRRLNHARLRLLHAQILRQLIVHKIPSVRSPQMLFHCETKRKPNPLL